ncbi:HNH endonuclease [Saccharopolyspora hattusasensis]|uniref:HNH endonuclease n=1 Tax=Saccharopolyspora hattusasensis TaxID=1128679 RepID=UPI003D96F5AB
MHSPGSRTGRPWKRVVQQLKALSNICWICGKQINLDLPPNHRMSFTADHIVPLSLGGSNTLDNARPAHRSCNSKRSNRIDYIPPSVTSRDW